jgi:activating signal cointegrator 1
MRVLSLWQPWASLVVLGAKRYETRSWSTSYVGWIAIHAAKHWDLDLRDQCVEPSFRKALFPANVTKGDIMTTPDLWPPRGAILGAAFLEACVPTSDPMLRMYLDLNPAEERFGDFSTGRYAWRFVDAYQLATPLPFVGGQGLRIASDDLARQLPTLPRIGSQ